MKLASLSLLLLFLASCAPSVQEPVASEEPESTLRTEEISYSVDDVVLKGYLAYDEAVVGQRPAVLVVHEWWGHDDYARRRARMLAEMGYTAFAVDMYGEGKQADHPDDAIKFMTEILQNMETGVARFNAALELLKNHDTTDPERVAAIGYCFGGGVVLHMARVGSDLDAVVSFHGGLESLHKPEAGAVKAKVLVCHGADDRLVPQAQIDAFKTEMDEAQVDYELMAYEGAVHSFTNPDADTYGEEFDLPMAYNAEADQQSWQGMQRVLDEVFVQ